MHYELINHFSFGKFARTSTLSDYAQVNMPLANLFIFVIGFNSCYMKYIITFWLLVIALCAGATTVSASKSKTELHKYRISIKQQSSVSDHHQTTHNTRNLLVGIGARNLRIRHTNSCQHLSFKAIRSSSKASRIRHSVKLEQQKYITSYTEFLLNSACSQTYGYFLFHLRKLLI